MPENATTDIENFMVTHDSFQTADGNYQILEEQLKTLAAALHDIGVMNHFKPYGLMRDYLDSMSLDGLR